MHPRTIALALVLCLLAAPAAAQPLVLPELPDGTYVLTVENGQPSLVRATPVDLTDDPKPPTPEDPDPTTFEAITEASQAAYEAIPDSPLKPVHALVVSSVYSAAAEQLRTGEATPASVTRDIRALQGGLPDEWSGWSSAVNAALEAAQDAGDVLTPDQWAAAMDATAAGLPAQAAEDVDDQLLEDRPILRAILLALADLGSGAELGPIVQLLVRLLPLLL